MPIARPYPILVALLLPRRLSGCVVEMRHGHLVGTQLRDEFHGAAAAENVEWIEHGRPGRMRRKRENIERGFDGVELLYKAEELERGTSASALREFEKLAVP